MGGEKTAARTGERQMNRGNHNLQEQRLSRGTHPGTSVMTVNLSSK